MRYRFELFSVVLFCAFVQACGPTGNLDSQQTHSGTNIVISSESFDGIEAVTIKGLITSVIDTNEWASVSALARPGVLYLALAPKDIWGLEFCQIYVDDGFNITSVSYDIFWPSSVQAASFYPSCPNSQIETYWTSECQTIPSSVFVIRGNHQASKQRGYQTTYAIGTGETLQNILNYLSCSSLKIWGRVGHGYAGGLQLTGGQMLTNFSGLDLGGKGIYANSCLAHNPPFEDTVLEAGTDWFISGDFSLYVGLSEKVFECWWDKAKDQADVCEVLEQCESSTNYPMAESHGCSGPKQTVSPPSDPDPSPGPTPYPTPTPDPTQDPDVELPIFNHQLVAVPSLSQGEWRFFVIDVLEGSKLSVNIGYGSGDADLYVKTGSRPSISSYDCKSDNAGAWESCFFSNPSGEYYIAVYAHQAFSGILLKASY